MGITSGILVSDTKTVSGKEASTKLATIKETNESENGKRIMRHANIDEEDSEDGGESIYTVVIQLDPTKATDNGTVKMVYQTREGEDEEEDETGSLIKHMKHDAPSIAMTKNEPKSSSTTTLVPFNANQSLNYDFDDLDEVDPELLDLEELDLTDDEDDDSAREQQNRDEEDNDSIVELKNCCSRKRSVRAQTTNGRNSAHSINEGAPNLSSTATPASAAQAPASSSSSAQPPPPPPPPDSSYARYRNQIQVKSEKKAAKILSAILLAFVVTWTPYNVLGK